MSWVSADTVTLVLGMMILARILGKTGVFDWIAVKAYILSGGKVRVLFILLCLLSALSSAVIGMNKKTPHNVSPGNVTNLLLVAPITVKLCAELDLSPLPFLVSQLIFSNIGGAVTMVGDAPNVM